jgi:hypothetical protein
MELQTIITMNKSIVVKSKKPINEVDILCICLAYKYIIDEYNKLHYILNEENRVLEAKYYALEVLQSECEFKEDQEWCDIISQYIINLDI